MRVLMVEDDPDILDVTTYALRKYGYEVQGVSDGAAAFDRWQATQPDLVLVDVNLPHVSGMDVCRQIREQSSVPIIMVTAHADEDRVAEGFESGADDYVGKPFSYRVLAMRMGTILRRHTHGPVLQSTTRAEAAGIVVDLDAHEVSKDGVVVRLTRLESRILYHLVLNAGRVITSDRLIELAWNYEGGDAFSLKTHISHIRQKLGVHKGAPGYISSVPHVGYTLDTAALG
jgi:DNA-binding response OmpR family regulator